MGTISILILLRINLLPKTVRNDGNQIQRSALVHNKLEGPPAYELFVDHKHENLWEPNLTLSISTQ